jgi:peptidoglycan hydrolase CwlO-like protein
MSIEKQLINSSELLSITKGIDKALRSVEDVTKNLEKGTKEIKRIESQIKKIKDLKDLF